MSAILGFLVLFVFLWRIASALVSAGKGVVETTKYVYHKTKYRGKDYLTILEIEDTNGNLKRLRMAVCLCRLGLLVATCDRRE
jgi:hypothetical protein